MLIQMTKKVYCSHCKNMKKSSDKDHNYKNHTIETCPELKNTVCFNCHEIGHTPKYCSKPKQVCILCQQMGHNESMCGYQSQILASSISFKTPYKSLGFEPLNWLSLNSKLLNS